MQRSPRDGHGFIEVICGGMFSGKTEELLSRVRRELIARKPVVLFKPCVDDRYGLDAVVSHDAARLPCISVLRAADILRELPPEVAVVGIDEVQFFGDDLVAVANELAERGLRVICAGLDMDFRGEPFDPMPRLWAGAEYVTKKQAVCVRCGEPASRSQRLSAHEQQVVVGAQGAYEARCRACHRSTPAAGAEQPNLPLATDGRSRPALPEQPPLPFMTGE